ncbi:superoxide dismutase family protein [Parasphingorhabdus marina]|uniref:superoxide dismutase family protein n=1 Tax=Parasphingorhabdus marina TaxID=394732 RepID=UPI003B83517D
MIVAEGDGGLILRIDATGLTPGAKGVHIHAVGQCEGPDFTSAGGHWNPEGSEHGFDNPRGAHKGDIVNLDVGPDGTGMLESTVDGATLKEGPNALLDEDGAAFVVHEGPDDFVTDPSGNSGARIACGVFALQKYRAAE